MLTGLDELNEDLLRVTCALVCRELGWRLGPRIPWYVRAFGKRMSAAQQQGKVVYILEAEYFLGQLWFSGARCYTAGHPDETIAEFIV